MNLPRPVAAPRYSPAELKPLCQRRTVLVVDDEPEVLDLLTKVLQRENVDLLTASGGEDALAVSDHAGRDLALLVTDYNMPGMTGRELADRLRARHPQVKVLYQTGFSDSLFGGIQELEAGAAFLDKPFTPRGLIEAARFLMFGTLNP